MTTKIFHIQHKNRKTPNTIVSPEDFSYLEGETIEPTVVLENDNMSLYCLDPQNQQVIFVETPLDSALSQASFFYEAQYELAQRLIVMPYSDFHQIAEKLEPLQKQVVLIYSVGRCGSTLLSKGFNQLDSVVSLSEPDVFSQMVMMRNPDGRDDLEMAKLLKSCLLLQTKSNISKPSSYVLKFRSFCIELGDLIYQAVPQAQAIFMYRNAEEVVKSAIRAFAHITQHYSSSELQKNIDFLSRFTPLLKEYVNYIEGEPSVIDSETISWLSIMHRYLVLYQQGVPLCAVRYEDLLANPQLMMNELFNYCGLQTSDVSHVFEEDSQEGTLLSQAALRQNNLELPDRLEIRNKMNPLLTKHPEIKTPDFIVPRTIGLGAF